MCDLPKSGGHRQIPCRAPLEQQVDDPAVSGSTPVPDGQIDRLKVGPEAAAEAACRAQNGVHVRATIEQQQDEVEHAATDRSMERRSTGRVADVHEARIRIESPANFIRVVAGDGGMDGMIVGSSEDSTAAIPRLLQQPHDLRVAALASP